MKYGVFSLLAAGLLAVGLLGGCGHKRHGKGVSPPMARIGATESGLASWYGHPYHGRAAANGEIYDMERLTAAHRTLPFDTWVRVRNLSNGKTVEVRIIDRGPFVEGRIIDLSHAAARAIDLIGPGVSRVRLEVIKSPRNAKAMEAAAATEAAPAPALRASEAPRIVETAEGARFAVQVGLYRDRKNAERVRADMAARYGAARIVEREGTPVMWRVLVGSEASEDSANALSDRIRRESGEKSAFVVRLDS